MFSLGWFYFVRIFLWGYSIAACIPYFYAGSFCRWLWQIDQWGYQHNQVRTFSSKEIHSIFHIGIHAAHIFETIFLCFIICYLVQRVDLVFICFVVFSHKIRRKQPSPEPTVRREITAKADTSINGIWAGPPPIPHQSSFDAQSPKSSDYDETDTDHKSDLLDRG